MLLVDSHCHLNFPDFREDLDAVIARARGAGVRVMQTICTRMSDAEEIVAIAERYEGVYASVGVHPHEVEKTPLVTPQELVAWAAHPKVIGLGETGLDYYYEHSPRAMQQESFRVHIEAARQTGLPLIVHTREAEEDTLAILEQEMAKGAFRGLIHCFSSSNYLAEKSIELGLYVSLSGILTFKSAETLRDTVRGLPMDRLLVETDAPYLAPMPLRGKRNEPSFVVNINKILADIHELDEVECAVVTTRNFFTLFDKATVPAECLP